MADEIKATRLSKAAREFNVGISTIVEFLHKKGINLDPNPNTKLPPEAYVLLVKEYSSDISVKKESEKLILKDLHRPKETVTLDDVAEKQESEENEVDEEILIKDTSATKIGVDIKTEIKKPDIKLVGKIDLEKARKSQPEKPDAEKIVGGEKDKAVAEADKKSEKAEEKPEELKEPGEEKKKSGKDITIVGKIDLEKVKKDPKAKEKEIADSEKKAEKAGGKKKTDKQEAEEEDAKTEPVKEELPEKTTEPEKEDDDEEVEVYKPGVKRLSGPTVVGKIDLPAEERKKSPGSMPREGLQPESGLNA